MTEQQTQAPQDQPQPQHGPQYGAPYQQYPPYQAPRRLMRTSDDQMVAGVCGGLARYLGVDPTLVRVGAVVALVLGFPATIIAYAVAWAIMPRA
jgi:phage shock protein C